MRFLLVNPPCPITENSTPPLGIAYLAAALENAGVEAEVMDFVVFPYTFAALESKIESFRPDAIGATCVTMTFHSAIQVIRDAKKASPEIVTAMGGPHVTFCADETLSLYPELDLIALGEGEKTIVKLAEAIDSKGDWRSIPGIAYRKDDKIYSNDKPDPIELDSLPIPARHLLPLGRYLAMNAAISMTTSRGCPYRCIFCVGRKMVGSKVRYRNPQLVLDEFERLVSLGFSQINVVDDLFTAKTDHCLEICEGIQKRGIKTKWTSFARVDKVNREVLTAMKEAGCATISFGVETGSEKILKIIKKGAKVQMVIDAFELCNEVGIMPDASFILGLPSESPETMKDTEILGKKVKDLGASHGFHLMTPFPGTAIRDENEKYDLKILTDDWSQYHLNRAVTETSQISADLLNDLAIRWEQGAEDNLQMMRDRIKSGHASEDEKRMIKGLDRFQFLHDIMMKELIENKGEWNNGDAHQNEAESIKVLANRIYSDTDYSENETFKLLKSAVDRGNLEYKSAGGRSRFSWRNYL